LALTGRRLRKIVQCTRNVRRGGASNHTRGAYAPQFTRELEKLHPDNRHVKDKIRQQLQVLPPSHCFGATSRDLGLLLHISSGVWRRLAMTIGAAVNIVTEAEI
jgi:hypothetical protein